MKRAILFSVLLTFLFFMTLTPLSAFCQHREDTRQQAFEPTFQTLRIIKNENFMLSPTLMLGSDDFLNFSFDEISDDYHDFQYRLVHCDSDWQPSQLLESEYLPGFNYADIEDYAFSSATFIHYVNYTFTIPNPQIAPLRSGNYLVEVFDRYDPDKTLLQFRFSVAEPVLSVEAYADGHTDRAHNADLQQVAIRLSGDMQQIPNPYQDLKVVVTQNRRPDTSRTITTPFRVERDRIIYEHNRDLIFPAANEYRRFETVRADYPGMRVDSVGFGEYNYHAWITEDRPRSFGTYQYDSTQAGRFFIREYNASDSDLGADYITCHFSLHYPESDAAEIYLDGDLTQHLPSSRFKLERDKTTDTYHLELPLKQGSYNYQYLRKMPDGTLQTAPIEGDFFETNNEYEIQVFLRTPSQRADRLIGTATIFGNH